VTLALLHPGEMGAAIGAALVEAGKQVHWASAGRSEATRERAFAARLVDDGDLVTLLDRCNFVISVCPPNAALDIANEVASAAKEKPDWIYLDANAVAPATASRVSEVVEGAGARYVDGGIIGPPPMIRGFTRLYLSGTAAIKARELLATDRFDVRVIDESPSSASALKLAYAAWTKGSAALLMAARAAAVRSGVDHTLLEEWRTSQPELEDRWGRARRSALEKGWRWSGEMREIASMFEELGLPSGFYTAAEEVFQDPTGFV
jgi:3-hydroxyisobutyrate dehydrogenase-like beta-hydroxyacid dehydrogenase